MVGAAVSVGQPRNALRVEPQAYPHGVRCCGAAGVLPRPLTVLPTGHHHGGVDLRAGQVGDGGIAIAVHGQEGLAEDDTGVVDGLKSELGGLGGHDEGPLFRVGGLRVRRLGGARVCHASSQVRTPVGGPQTHHRPMLAAEESTARGVRQAMKAGGGAQAPCCKPAPGLKENETDGVHTCPLCQHALMGEGTFEVSARRIE